MSRTHLLGAASAVALSFVSAAHADSSAGIQGGGSTLAQFQYIDEFSIFNGNSPAAPFASYWESGSGAGQSAFLNDDLSCDTNKVTGNNGGNCSNLAPTATNPTTGGPNYVDYGASDATLSTTQIASWSTSSYGQAVSGNLIQLPSMGVGISIPVINSKIVKNGDTSVTDHDLCEIFSGGYTDFSQITDSQTLKGAKNSYAPGTISVIYRGDSSGTSFLLTQHLAAVCTPNTDTAPGFTFTATTTFASLFNAANGGGSNTKNSAGLFVVTSGLYNGANDAGKGSGGVASLLETGGVPAIGYLSPDFTTVDPKSDATVNGAPSTLVVAGVQQGSTSLLPTVANITKGLSHAVAGQHLNPPSTAAQGLDPSSWVPLVARTSAGYPIVGYTTFDFAQCYVDNSVGSSIVSFLTEHLNKKGPFSKKLADNGFVAVSNSAAAKFVTTITQHILSNKGSKKAPAWNQDINDTTVCKNIGR